MGLTLGQFQERMNNKGLNLYCVYVCWAAVMLLTVDAGYLSKKFFKKGKAPKNKCRTEYQTTISYENKCSDTYEQVCSTVKEELCRPKVEEVCNTVNVKECSVSHDRVCTQQEDKLCSTKYEDKCTTVYEEE